MAEETKSKPKSKSTDSGSVYKTEQPVMVDTTGIDIRELLGRSAGKDFDDMTTQDFENFASSKGVIRKDIKRMSKAFDAVKKNASRQYLVDTDGFNVIQENLPLSRSGRDIGNKKGLDIGDLVGLGNNVSLLAGFASREVTNYRKERDKKAAQSASITDEFDTSSLTEQAGGNRKAQMPNTSNLTASELVNPQKAKKSPSNGKSSSRPSGPSPEFEEMITNFGKKYNSPSQRQSSSNLSQQSQKPKKENIVDRAVDFTGVVNRDVEKRNRAEGSDGVDDTFLENLRTWKNFWQSVFTGPTKEAPATEERPQKSKRSPRDMGSGAQFTEEGVGPTNTYY